MGSFFQDLRYAARTLKRSPSFTLVVSMTLALGIGANTAIFSVIDALTLRKPAVADPDRLVTFSYSDDQGDPARFAVPEVSKYSDMTRIFSSVAAFQVVRRAGATVVVNGAKVDAGSLDVAMVSPAFFPTLGVSAAAGRTLSRDDGAEGGRPVATAGARFARHVFGSAPAAVGKTVTVLGTTFTLVGVLPDRFQGPWTGRDADLWVPLAMQPAVMPERPDLMTNSRVGFVLLLGRLQSGVTLRQASDAANAAFQNGREMPPASAVMTPERIEILRRLKMIVEPVASVATPDRARLATPLTLLVGAVTLVLLIACLNVSNLLLARATSRNREIAIRLALGSGHIRLLRQLLAESALLALGGTAIGLLIAAWGADALVGLLSDPRTPLNLTLAPDGRLVAFAAALCLLTAAVFGLAPALRLRTMSLTSAFSTYGNATAVPSERRAVNILMAAQIALSAVLLVGAALFAQSLHNLRTSDTGFDKSHLVLAWFDSAQGGYDGGRTLPLYDALIARVGALPGVERVSASNRGVFAGIDTSSPVVVPGRAVAATDDYWVAWSLVADNFFDATGMTVLSGRPPNAGDTAGSRPAVAVNEAFARKYFGTSDAVGRQFHMRRETAPPVEIIGVVRDARLEDVREAGVPMIFVPYRQDPGHLSGQICVIVRTRLGLAEIAPAIRRVARQAAPEVPLVSIQTADAQVEETLAVDRATATLSVVFGALAGLLVLVGLYGLLAYSVECRTSEIGIRSALGATRRDVVWMVLKEGSSLVVIGLAAGLPLAWIVSRTIAGQLFGVAPGDPATFTAVAVFLSSVGLAAGVMPALRAAHVDPMRALRRE